MPRTKTINMTNLDQQIEALDAKIDRLGERSDRLVAERDDLVELKQLQDTPAEELATKMQDAKRQTGIVREAIKLTKAGLQ
jgi:hypothetical protein